MNKITCLLCLLFVVATYAQDETNDDLVQLPEVVDSYFTFSILSPIAFETPRYRFGYIRPIGKKWMVGLDAAYGDESITYKSINLKDNDDYRLYEFRAEVYYILPVKRKSIHYLSLEVGYVNHQETFFDNSYKDESTQKKVRYEQADYQRTRSAITLKYGAFYKLWGKFGVNPYYGIGIRQRNNDYTNVIQTPRQIDDFPGPDEDRDEFGFVEDYYRKEGTRLGINFQLGVKLYYQIE
tara:strand:+ start:563 stop:1276 length:714 start_codon:yes stop_codon:yes gene_type:complete